LDPTAVKWSDILRLIAKIPGIAKVLIWRYQDYHRVFPQVLNTLLGQPRPEVPSQLEKRVYAGVRLRGKISPFLMPIPGLRPGRKSWCAKARRRMDKILTRSAGPAGSQFLNDVFQRVVTPLKSAYLRLITNVLRIIMARTNPFQFIQQTRAEITKVVWPTRREVLITTAMVLVLAIIAAIFFSGIDAVIRLGLRSVLGMF